MANEKNQIAQQLNEAQMKYTYFLLAVAASAIAFSIQQTSDESLNWEHLPLGVALASWCYSFFAGCQNRELFASALYANVTLLQLRDLSHPDTPATPEFREAACEGVRDAACAHASNASKWAYTQFRALVFGGAAFLVWHILRMIP